MKIIPRPDQKTVMELLREYSPIPTVLAQIIWEYTSEPPIMRIPFFNASDDSFLTRGRISDPKNAFSLFGRYTPWFLFGPDEIRQQLPIVRRGHFKDNQESRSKLHIPAWNYQQIGAALCPERAQLFDHATDQYSDPCHLVPGLSNDMMKFLMTLLVRSQIIVKLRTDAAVINAQNGSRLLCVDIGPREFAQLLKNAALFLRQVRKELGKNFAHVNPIYGPDADSIIDQFVYYSPLLDEVINDKTETLTLSFNEVIN